MKSDRNSGLKMNNEKRLTVTVLFHSHMGGTSFQTFMMKQMIRMPLKIPTADVPQQPRQAELERSGKS